MRKDVTPTHHRRGVSFHLPDDHDEKEREKERIKALFASGNLSEVARAKAAIQVAKNQAAAAAAAAATQTVPAADQPIAEGFASAAASSNSTAASASYPLTRQQKTAFHPLTTPSSLNPASRITPLLVSGAHGHPNPSPPLPAHPSYSQLTTSDGAFAVAIRIPGQNGNAHSSPIPTPSPPAANTPGGQNFATYAESGLASPPPQQHHTYTNLAQRNATPAAPFTG
ncbi:MAG: hypothetical protein Q7T57_02455, partial [Dehalococcoidales bacterium]|nr:hypothetical protein [Dehalococcoidales bacterium]